MKDHPYSTITLTKQDLWKIWVQDLEERMNYHLYQHAERKKLLTEGGKGIVEVRESDSVKGTWEVWEGGRKRFIYDGSLGHYRATKKASEILKELQGS